MKKEKFTIEFDSYECYMSKTITISKKEFYDQLKYLDDKVIEYADDEINMEQHISTYEDERMIKTIYRYVCGCATTRLIHYKLKGNYVFTKCK